MSLALRFAARSDRGLIRGNNQDSVYAGPRLLAVADGMGGHAAGDVASKVVIAALEHLDDDAPSGDLLQALREAVFDGSEHLREVIRESPQLEGMGTTLTAILFAGGRLALCHVGDSRAYLMRDGTVTQVTDDHSLVEQLVREGRLSPEEAQHHPQRAIITRALGVEPQVEVDTYRVDLEPGDRLLICSDGLTNMLSDDTIALALRRHPDPQQAADTLVDMANQAGGDDNITVVVVDALADGGNGPAASAAEATAAEPAAAPLEPEPEVAPVEPPPAGARHESEPAGRRTRLVLADDEPVTRRRRGLRGVVVWGLPILIVVGIAVGAVGWYARRTYYVGLSGDRVTLFKGVPGGLLGWQPTVDRQTDLTAGDLTPADRADLESGHRFASLSDADRFLARLQQTHEALAGSTTTTSPATDAATAPAPATTSGSPGPTR
jgi:protein phosphatase